MTIAESIQAEFTRESEVTRRVLDRIPADKLAWRPHPKSFSLGQLALHTAVVPGAVAQAVLPDTMEAPSFIQPEAQSLQEIHDAFAHSLTQVAAVLAQLDDAKMFATWTLTRNGQPVMSVPRIGFIRSVMLNHVYHHRGQLSVYLRLLDVPLPSIYGPSADENPFA